MSNFLLFELRTVNPNVNFIRGFIFKSKDEIFDIDIYGSHQRIADKWQKIEYSKRVTPDGIIFEFDKPTNSYQFKIISHCVKINHEDLTYLHFSPLDINQTFSFLKKKKVVFLGCARNCEVALDASIKSLSKLGDLFQEYSIHIIENDSDDKTVDKLKEHQSLGKIEFFSLGKLESKISNRIQRLSYCRNILLDKLNLKNIDYVIVSDLDGVVGNELSIESFISNFQYDGCWEGCFPINTGFYYDIYAFRNSEISLINLLKKLNQVDYVWGENNAKKLIIESIHKSEFKNLIGWLEVESAFGGMAIYRADAIKSSRYTSYVDGEEDCEHVGFHKALKQQSNARFYINPKFIVNGLNT